MINKLLVCNIYVISYYYSGYFYLKAVCITSISLHIREILKKMCSFVGTYTASPFVGKTTVLSAVLYHLAMKEFHSLARLYFPFPVVFLTKGVCVCKFDFPKSKLISWTCRPVVLIHSLK